jgi:hypothetical protein
VPTTAVAPFATRSTPWLVGLAIVSLLASLWLLIRPGDTASRESVGADGYSRSALGHLGLVRLLREQREAVVQSRSMRGPGPCGLLVVAEPRDIDRAEDLRMQLLVETAPATLVVLPKRSGEADPVQPGWIGKVELVSAPDVDAVGRDAADWGDGSWSGVVRTNTVGPWALPSAWQAPTAAAPWQLMATRDDLVPIVSCPEGVLLGRIGSVHVLSDPDLIANHGLHRGDNTALVLAMLRSLRTDGAIVFDETLHGHRLAPSVWHLAGRYPLVLVTCHVLLLLAVLAWIAHGRFGPVLAPAAAIGAGKAFLLDNIAALLRAVGAAGPSLRRYGRQRVRTVAEALQAPRGLDDAQCREFVAARMPDAARRDELRALLHAERDVAADRAVAAARRIRTLTEDLLHARSRDR